MSLAAPRCQPFYDIYATLVFSAMAPDVRDVMVAGRWLMRDRVVLSMDRAKAIADAAQVAAQFRSEIRAMDHQTTG